MMSELNCKGFGFNHMSLINHVSLRVQTKDRPSQMLSLTVFVFDPTHYSSHHFISYLYSGSLKVGAE